MIIEIKIPSPGESITEVTLATWLVNDGSYVEKDQEVAEVESDKATLPLISPENGAIKILINASETIKVGTIACTIDTEASVPDNFKKPTPTPEKGISEETLSKTVVIPDNEHVKVTPVAKKIMEEYNLSISNIKTHSKRIGKEDIESIIQTSNGRKTSGRETRIKMSALRKKLSARLIAVKNETAMLTTFNEADMSEIIHLRKTYQEQFIAKHGVKLGFMSFFTKAVTKALKVFPMINSMIDGEDIVTPLYYDISIAVQTDKGLTVPVIRNAENLSLAEIEKSIANLADKARKNRLSIDEMTGGTFTITNGGIFGSLLSTPILNPPQSAILGMHTIQERPVAIKGKVEICPMMYLALSYDHRIIDGRDSVGFLVKVKEFIEKPVTMIIGNDLEKLLLDL